MRPPFCQLLRATFENDCLALAVAVALYPTVQQVHAFHQGVGTGTIHHQLTVALHRPQALA